MWELCSFSSCCPEARNSWSKLEIFQPANSWLPSKSTDRGTNGIWTSCCGRKITPFWGFILVYPMLFCFMFILLSASKHELIVVDSYNEETFEKPSKKQDQGPVRVLVRSKGKSSPGRSPRHSLSCDVPTGYCFVMQGSFCCRKPRILFSPCGGAILSASFSHPFVFWGTLDSVWRD